MRLQERKGKKKQNSPTAIAIGKIGKREGGEVYTSIGSKKSIHELTLSRKEGEKGKG